MSDSTDLSLQLKMLKLQLEKDWLSKACLDWLPGESLFSLFASEQMTKVLG